MRYLALCFFSLAVAGQAVIVDRIAVTVGNQAITDGQIDQEIRLSSLLNQTDPEITAAARRAASDRLVEQALIRREMSFGSYPPVPAAQIDQAVASTEKARGGAAALDGLLKKDRLTRRDLRDYLEWQLALLKFIELRFRPAVEVTNEDVENYYKAHVAVKPAPDGTTPSLRDLHDQIEQKLTGERVDIQLDEWIKRSRTRTALRYVDATLAPAAAAGEPAASPQ